MRTLTPEEKVISAEKRKAYMKNFSKEYKTKNAETVKAVAKRYYFNHKELSRSRNKEWQENNPDKMKSHRLKYRYGITIEDYNEMLTLQVSGCSICGKTAKENGKALYVDHDHETGKVRGLLCYKCNTDLGTYETKKELFEAYLNKHNEKDING
jgi:hypothetical protein